MSYILAKVLFRRNSYGIAWIFADILEVHTTISAEKNMASKVQKIKPRIRIAQSLTDSVSTSRRSEVNMSIDHGSSRILSSITEKSSSFAEDSIIVIESPVYADISYATREADKD